MADLFTKLNRERPPADEPKKEQPPVVVPRGPLLQPIAPEANPQSSPAEKLLDFVVNHWREPTISVRNIQRCGPNSIREDRKAALKAAKILAENGWLAAIPSHRRDRRQWRIARGPGGTT